MQKIFIIFIAVLFFKCSNPSESIWEINSDLVFPDSGAIMDNRNDEVWDALIWYFEWIGYQDVEYQLYVKHKSAEMPFIDIKTYDYYYTYFTFRFYIGEENLKGWTWKIRGKYKGVWSTWSEEREFDVEPENTDPNSEDLHKIYLEQNPDKNIEIKEPVNWALMRGVEYIPE